MRTLRPPAPERNSPPPRRDWRESMAGLASHYDLRRFDEEPGLKSFTREYLDGEFWPLLPYRPLVLHVRVVRTGRETTGRWLITRRPALFLIEGGRR